MRILARAAGYASRRFSSRDRRTPYPGTRSGLSPPCCFFAEIAAQRAIRMSHRVFFSSRGDRIHGHQDIFARLPARCFEKEKRAFTFPNYPNNLDRGVEGGLDISGTVSFRCFRAAHRQARAVSHLVCLPSSGREGRPFYFQVERDLAVRVATRARPWS